MEIRKEKKLYIKKSTIEWILTISLFFISFINYPALLLFLAFLMLFFFQGEIGAIKIMALLTLRTIINPGIAVDLDRYQAIKLGMIFLSSVYIVFKSYKIPKEHKRKSSILITSILIFGLYNILSSWFFSTFPLVAVFKIISYIIPFIAVIIGILITNDKIDWVKWLGNLFNIILIPSLFLVNTAVGYLVNGFGYQGITNQPNMLGPIMVLYLAILFTQIQEKSKRNIYNNIKVGAVFYVIILSKSRTSLISGIILLLLFLFFWKKKFNKKILYFIIVSIVSIVIILFFYDDLVLPLINFTEDFFYKGQNTILYSRANQVNSVLSNFYRNPFFGTGFGVPVTQFKSYVFSTDIPVEPGNIIFSVLSYGGIFGFILFFTYIFLLFYQSKKQIRNTLFLFLSPLLVSMGEMVFFSTNNIGILCYILLALYYAYDEKT